MAIDSLERLTIGLNILDRLQSKSDIKDIAVSSPRIPKNYDPYHKTIELNPVYGLKILIGIAYDGLPILYDFSNPGAGTVLTISNHPEQILNFLSILIRSVSNLNNVYNLKTYFLMDQKNLVGEPGSKMSGFIQVNVYSGLARKIIRDLAAKSEQRKYGREEGEITILMVDLNGFYQYMDNDTELLLNWLLTNGPKSNIFPFVFLLEQELNLSMLNQNPLFSTVIISSSLVKAMPEISGIIDPCNNIQDHPYMMIIDGELVPFSI